MRTQRLAITILTASAWATSAQALPPVPKGWQAERNGGQQVYRATGLAYAEVRLFATEPVAQGLRDWFGARTQQTVQGATITKAGDTQLARDLMAYSESLAQDAQGKPLAVIRGGCITPQKQALYGEMLLSVQASYDNSLPQAGLKIILDACVEAIQAANKTAKNTGNKVASAPATQAQPEAYAYYKPGAGLKDAQIEAIVHAWSNEQSGMTMQVVDYFYVLLKDGSYYEDLPPVALSDFDVAASRAGQPRRWGKWRKRNGQFEIAPTTNSNAFSAIANQSLREPAKKDERLDGTWRHASAYSTPWSVARSSRSVHFTRDGRFEQTFDSSVVGGAGSESAGNAVHGTSQTHNDCSSGTMGGGNFTSRSTQCQTSTAPDRTGSYSLDGYTLVLRYDSGRVERVPFCARADRKDIWFAGWDMSRQKAD